MEFGVPGKRMMTEFLEQETAENTGTVCWPMFHSLFPTALFCPQSLSNLIQGLSKD